MLRTCAIIANGITYYITVYSYCGRFYRKRSRYIIDPGIRIVGYDSLCVAVIGSDYQRIVDAVGFVIGKVDAPHTGKFGFGFLGHDFAGIVEFDYGYFAVRQHGHYCQYQLVGVYQDVVEVYTDFQSVPAACQGYVFAYSERRSVDIELIFVPGRRDYVAAIVVQIP